MTCAAGSRAIQPSNPRRQQNNPGRGLHTAPGLIRPSPFAMELDIMTLHHKAKRCQLPDLFDWVTERDSRVADHRVRWVARRCRVPFATAETIIANAGFSDGE